MAYYPLKVKDNSGNTHTVGDPRTANKADLASPTFTGTPTAPTAAAGTNTTQIATTAFVQAVTGLKSSQVPTVDVNAQSASYTLALADAGKLILMTSGSAQTVTIPPNSSVAFPVGTKIDIIQTGAGQCDVAPGAGVTLNSDTSKRKVNVQYAAVSIIKTATDTWLLIGALKA